MAKLIKSDTTQLIYTVARAQLAGESLDTKLDCWTSQGEQSVALEAYAEQFVALERAMKQLQDLIAKDAADVTKAAVEMMVADLNLAKLWD